MKKLFLLWLLLSLVPLTACLNQNAEPEIQCPEITQADVMMQCQVYYDGCNTCIVQAWEIGDCTKKECSTYSEPYCREYLEWQEIDPRCIDKLN